MAGTLRAWSGGLVPLPWADTHSCLLTQGWHPHPLPPTLVWGTVHLPALLCLQTRGQTGALGGREQ